MKTLLKYITLLGILMLPTAAISQDKKPPKTGDTEAQIKRMDKLDKKKAKDKKKAEKELFKQHLALQDKATQKRMKATKKKSKKLKKNKKDPFFVRWFRKK